MRNLIRAGLAIFVVLSLGSCARGPQRGPVQLFPANEVAGPSGVIDGEYLTNGSGNGSLQFRMPDGEVVSGQYSIVQSGTITTTTGFGSIYASVYGGVGTASGFATSSASTAERVSPGMASLFGDRGTSMQCEFRNDNVTHHGFGACRTSKGALFRAQF